MLDEDEECAEEGDWPRHYEGVLLASVQQVELDGGSLSNLNGIEEGKVAGFRHHDTKVKGGSGGVYAHILC